MSRQENNMWVLREFDTRCILGSNLYQAIKEFSTSRLKCQALQQRQKESSRARLRRPRPGDTPSCKPAVDKPANDTGPWGEPEMKDPESDPLGLIRREIAVMKKLE